MNRSSDAFRQLAKNRKQDHLAGDKIFVFFVALQGLVAAAIIVYAAGAYPF